TERSRHMGTTPTGEPSAEGECVMGTKGVSPKFIPRRLIDMTGAVIGGQTVIAQDGVDRHGQARWSVRCVCGAVRSVAGGKLRRGEAGSCGCLKPQKLAVAHTRHGAAAGGVLTPEYRAWSGMIDRCERPSFSQFADYGGRGITVCAEWRRDFAAFLTHVGPRPSDKHSVDRIDNARGYEPGNVRWATKTEQNRNKRTSKTGHLIDAAAANGIKHGTLYARIVKGWSEHAAVNTPTRRGAL
ncbi:MAG: hypothetical protein ACRCZ2_03400, partial [Fusobacteriaceae bacterium]